MPNILKEVGVLRDEGKLHKKLITRVRMLLVISVILAGITLFNVIFRGTNPLLAAGLFIVGFLVGLYVFSRMNVIQWNEELEIVEAGRMDAVGYSLIALYVAFEIGLRTFLSSQYPISASILIFAAIAGTIFGRAIGTVVEIHRVFKRTHPGA